MVILIDSYSGVPIYEQIFGQIRRQIISGELPPGEPLPSIRNLAKDLRISVITTKRAYEELEGAGLIYTVPGKGSFAASTDKDRLTREHSCEIEKLMGRIVLLARECGLEDKELREMYSRIKEEK